ncbi:MAG: cupin domain-containing protein [Acidimicrobiia bacterium]
MIEEFDRWSLRSSSTIEEHMMTRDTWHSRSRNRVIPILAAGALVGAGVAASLTSSAQPARAAEPSGVPLLSEVLGKATVDGEVHLHHRGLTQVVVQRLTVAPGVGSGWHSHPGPHLVLVTSGHSTVYETDCSRHTYGPGDAFLVEAGHVHFARNEGNTPQAQLVVHFVEPDASLFVPEPTPRHCAVH